MNRRAVSLAAAVACASLLGSPAVRAADDIHQTGSLPHGGAYAVYQDATIGAAAIDLWFRAPANGYDGSSPGIARVAATAAAAAKLESGRSLAETVRALGGRLSINVYPDITGITVVVPSAATRRAVASLTSAYFAPSIDDGALKIAQRDAAVLAVYDRYASDVLLHDALFAELFRSGPAHDPPVPDVVADLTRVSVEGATAFAKRAFRSSNAYLTMAGDVDASLTRAVTAGKPGTGDEPVVSPRNASPAADSNVAGNVSGVGLAWIGPPIGDERAATAMDFIADYLFRDETGVVSKALRDTNQYAQGQFITLHDPGVMLVTIGGTNKLDDARQRVADAIAGLQRPLDRAAFDAAREAFLFHIAVDSQEPSEQADNLGWYAAEGNASYAPAYAGGAYWTAARSLEPAYVASVAKQYLSRPVVVRLIAAAKENTSP